MEGLSYQQLLAQTYQESAKNLLVTQNEYEDDEQVDEHEENDYENNELDAPEEFNRFHGDRNKPEHVVQPKPTDKQKSTLKRDTDVRNIVLNIDSAFRGSLIPSATSSPAEDFNPGATSSWFIFNPSRLYRNITSVKLTSLEFPNTFYSFSTLRGNTTFTLVIDSGAKAGTYNVTIPDGNYLNSSTTLTLDPTTFINAIKTYITTAAPNGLGITGFDVTYNGSTHRITFSYAASSFSITFPTTTSNAYKNGIGYNLGFYQTSYSSTYTTPLTLHQIIADVPPDVVQDKYIYLQINDWNLIDHQNVNQTFFPVFAKIQLPGTKNTIVFDSNYINSSTKEYFFQQPVNVQRLEIKLLDAYGNVLETDGENWSMTLELKQVNDSATYEALNLL